jgi:hypothetical protein
VAELAGGGWCSNRSWFQSCKGEPEISLDGSIATVTRLGSGRTVMPREK